MVLGNKGKTMARHIAKAVVALTYALLVVSLLSGCGRTDTDKMESALTQLPEGKLAALDAGSLNINEAMVNPYRMLLDSLKRKCSEPRNRIGDFAVAGIRMLRDKGKVVTIRSFLMLMDNHIPQNVPAGTMKCAEIASAVVVLHE
jgi:hypothetical protein